ncbi:MAG TPA: hypothetical protein VJP89_01790 [Pyrinomonadaceae bacterium]|nr:hypothetical protein [Pyrinomonadaceae bacterium]
MKMKTLLMGVGLGALVSLSALTATAQTNQMRQYEWKRRTEVQRKGDTKNVQVVLVGYDANGRLETTPISGTREPDLPKFALRKVIAEKKFKEFKETVRELGELARSYSELTQEQMQKFMASASMRPEMIGGRQLMRVDGSSVLHTRDSMTIWTDPVSRRQQRVEIQTVLDDKPVRIISEFKDLSPSGPTYMAVSRINYDDGSIAIITENFDHQTARK